MKALMASAALCTIAMAAQTAYAADSSNLMWSLDTRSRAEASEQSFAAGSAAALDWRDPRAWGGDSGADRRGDYDEIGKWVGRGDDHGGDLSDDDHREISAVPEPSTWALLLLGAASLSWVRMRKSRTD